MSEVSSLQREISDLTRILSLIAKRGPEFEEQSQESHVHQHGDFGHEIDDEDHDETELDGVNSTENVDVDTTKRRTLDRLAEILARFKHIRGSTKEKKGSLDAKHVTSVIIVEELGKSVTLFCAKNEGLDDADRAFLRALESLLGNKGTTGKQTLS